MSKRLTLRVLVNTRLTAAAEEIFVLFERTIAEYEEELCRSKEENQRKQEQLDSISSRRTGPGLNQGLDQDLDQGLDQEPPQIKAEPEEQLPEPLPVAVPESSAVCVKTEESSQLQQGQTEHRKETQGVNINAEPHLHSETEGDFSDIDYDEDWRAPFSCSAAQMETEADGDHYSQVQIRGSLSPKYQPLPDTGAAENKGDMSGTAEGAERKKHLCPMCQKGFQTKQGLQNHIRIHTGEKPFSCLICNRTFSKKSNLDRHMRTHSGVKTDRRSMFTNSLSKNNHLHTHVRRKHMSERPYSCPTCERTFSAKGNLIKHVRTHTGERPYRCSTCDKAFALKYNLDSHMRTHTGEKPYSCSICDKAFSQKNTLVTHVRTHTGERPYCCSICKRTFSLKSSLNKHVRTHTDEKPYSCSFCDKGFTLKSLLKRHMESHRTE